MIIIIIEVLGAERLASSALHCMSPITMSLIPNRLMKLMTGIFNYTEYYLEHWLNK
jgi:hypothetical protein